MPTDEDHNYYSQAHHLVPEHSADGQSRAVGVGPDAAHDQSSNPDDLLLLTAQYYRQSQQLSSPKRPTITTNFATGNSNRTNPPRFAADVGDDKSPDPHEFYRQYRGSSRREGKGTYGGIGLATSTSEESMSTLHASARPSQFSTRGTGYGPRANRSEGRLAPSSNSSATAAQVPRGRRQSSLQALVDKFNQNPDEIPPLPSNPASRSTSANHSPASATGARSFRRRVSNEPPLKRAPPPVDRSVSGSTVHRKPAPATEKRRITNNHTYNTGTSSTSLPRQSGLPSNATASHSMIDLSPVSQQQQPARKLLFGEIDSSSLADPGFPVSGHRRRGSEGSLDYTRFASKENSTQSSKHVSPSSPTAWYMGVTPTLDGIDLSNAAPPRPGMHRRSHSELGPKPSALAKNIANMSPPQEQTTPDMSPQPDRRSHQSKIPISARRSSAASSDSQTYSARDEQRSALPPPRTPDRVPHSSIPRKSPRTNVPEALRQTSPRLAAFISEPPPVKSPPLRSSRPRQPVSTATTSASRARAAAVASHRNATRDKSGKSLPELGGVDLAARRERIQRAFTTKVKEKEIETEKKRQSLIHEAQMLRNQESKAGLSEERNAAQEKDIIKERSFENLKSEQESFSAQPTRERVLKINTGGPEGTRTVVVRDEDSPTLGTAGFLVQAAHDESSDAEPSSSLTSATEETFFDNEVQESTEPAPFDRQSRVGEHEEQSNQPSAIGAHASLLTNRSQERDDAESIQIMLQDIPITEVIETSASNPKVHKQLNETPEASGSTVQGPWSPNSPMATVSGVRESDTYTMVNRFLDSYHDNALKSPPNIQEFQRQLLEYSPELARQGNWDPQKVTQLYLQHVSNNQSQHSTQKPFDAYSNHYDAGSGNARRSSKSPAGRSPMESEFRSYEHAGTSNSLEAPAVANLKRASASLNDPDDWANTSPSMLDWIHHQAMDTPVEEVERPFPHLPTPPGEPNDTTHAKSSPALLPDIQGIGGLGIDVTTDQSIAASIGIGQKPTPIAVRHSITRPSPLRSESYIAEKELPEPPGPASSFEPTYVAASATQEQSSSDEPAVSRQGDTSTIFLQQRGRTATESSIADLPSTENTSITESYKSTITPAEQKRLTKRRHILKELVDTESSFGQDMTVVVDIYKGTSNVILNSPEDVKILFGNAADIVLFSTTFLDALKQASKSVYVLPKSKRWKSKRDSSATTGSTTTDDQVSIAGMDLSDDDRDRMTTIGTAFDDNLTQMEKVYTEYLKNHDAANQKLQQLQKSDKVKIWLKECRAYAHDLTSAWDLDSLLVKPVQRILKYPLLLKEILEVTPENHPDYFALDNAAREMVGVSKRINEAKRRADLVEQVTNGPTIPVKPPKRKDTDTRLGLGKAFGRRADKAKQQFVAVENVQDRAYNAVADKFGSHFFQLQVVMRDVEMYVTEVQGWVDRFNDFALAIESYMDVGQTNYTEIESKWRRFRLSMREMQKTALGDHVNAVRKHVIDPMTTLLKLHDGPQKLMDKRKKRVGEYARYKAIRDRGEKPDKKTAEQGEQFLAVNDTLKDELPKLFALTGKLVESCLQNFVQLQMQWLTVWKAKLRQAIDCSQIPETFGVIFNQFSGDFRYTEAQVLSLGLCNGSLLANTANFVSFLGPDESSRRASASTEESRSRATSNTMYERARARGLSANSGKSPMIPSPDFGRSADGLGITGHSHNPYSVTGNYPPLAGSGGKRIRASSVASGRSPGGPDGPANYRTYTGQSYGHRPSTSTGRSFDSPSMPRPSYEGGSGAASGSGFLHPDADSTRYGTSASGSSHRHSGVFSSAMPMSDSPRTESPAPDSVDPGNVNVLFLAASVYEFNIDRARREAGYPYLTYVAGEIFDVIGEKGELWLAKNQDDSTNQIGWIWNKHFAKLAG